MKFYFKSFADLFIVSAPIFFIHFDGRCIKVVLMI